MSAISMLITKPVSAIVMEPFQIVSATHVVLITLSATNKLRTLRATGAHSTANIKRFKLNKLN